MFCQKCGNEVLSGDVFCSSCGERVEPQQQYQIRPEVNPGSPYQWQPPAGDQNFTPLPQQDIVDAEAKSRASLVMGILSMALCWLFGIPGIILGPLAISNGRKARRVLNETHYFYWNALAGVITGSIGLALSIFFTVFYFMTILLAAAVNSM